MGMQHVNLFYDFRLQTYWPYLKKIAKFNNYNEKSIKLIGPIRFVLAMGNKTSA